LNLENLVYHTTGHFDFFDKKFNIKEIKILKKALALPP